MALRALHQDQGYPYQAATATFKHSLSDRGLFPLRLWAASRYWPRKDGMRDGRSLGRYDVVVRVHTSPVSVSLKSLLDIRIWYYPKSLLKYHETFGFNALASTLLHSPRPWGRTDAKDPRAIRCHDA